MKKILILYAAVGGGHYRAADGIKKYIDENFNGQFNVELIDGLANTSKLWNNMVIGSYVKMARYHPKRWKKLYIKGGKNSFLDTGSNLIHHHLAKILYKKYFNEQDPGLVISSHFFTTDMVTYLKKKGMTKTKLAVILTDYAPHRYWLFNSEFVDYYFVANEQMKYELIHSGIAEEKITVTGIPVRPEFTKTYDREKTLSELGLDPSKKTFLVFGGGQYGMSDASVLFKGILNVKQDIQIIAIAGKSESTKATFEYLSANSNKKVAVLGFTDKVAELMYASDFVVSKPGGLTTTEILVSNKPFIIFSPVPGQEEANVNFLTNNGAAFMLHDLTKTTPQVEQLIDDTFRTENMITMQKHIARPDSTKTIVEKLLL